MQMSTTCPAVFTLERVRSTEIRLNSSGHAAYLVEDKEPSSHCLPKGIFYLIKAINKSFIWRLSWKRNNVQLEKNKIKVIFNKPKFRSRLKVD